MRSTGDSYGYSSTSTSPGSLSDPDFRFGTMDYTVTAWCKVDGELNLFLDKDLPQASAAGLVLHVCGVPVRTGGQRGQRGSGGDLLRHLAQLQLHLGARQFRPRLVGCHTTRRVWLSRADTTAPMLVPPPDGVVADGAALTLTFDEQLDQDSEPAPDAFTLAVARPGAAAPPVRVTGVTLSGGEVVLTLSEPVRHGDTARLAYAAPAQNPLQDPAGNVAAGFGNRPVTVPANELATGTVEISPDRELYTVGDILTATVSGVADADGLPNPSAYEYQWLRIDGTLETPIDDMGTGKTKTYTLVDADAGKQVRVRLRFRDLGNNLEQLESAARPRYGRVMWPAADAVAAACATPAAVANGTEELIWTAEVTVGTGTRAGFTSPYGYSLLGGGFGFGDLTDHDFRFGNDNYTVDILIAHSDGLHFGLASDLPPATAAGLVLHVCDEAFELRHSPGDSINYGSTSFAYSWGNDFPDWSGHSTRRVWLTRADTTAPMLLPQPDGVVVEGAALTLTFDEALDAGSEPEPAADAFTLAVTRPGAAASETEGIEVTGVRQAGGRRGRADARASRCCTATSVTLAYAAPAAKPLQDPAGNAVAGFTRTAHNATPEGPRVVSVAFVQPPPPPQRPRPRRPTRSTTSSRST